MNKIQIGDTVLLPAFQGVEAQFWVADVPTPAGQHDCIWVICQNYVYGQLATESVNSSPVTSSDGLPLTWVPRLTPPPVEKDNSSLIGLLLALVVALALGAYFLWQSLKKRKERNPDLHPPMGGNLDSMDRNSAVASLRRLLQPGETMISLRRGRLLRNSGPSTVTVDMEFGDRQTRTIQLRSGERVATVIAQAPNGARRTQHLRTACSNGFGSEDFTLPAGWVIIYDESESEGVIPAQTANPTPVSVPTHVTPPANVNPPAPTFSPDFDIDGEEVARIIDSARGCENLVIEINPGLFRVEIKNLAPSKQTKTK